MLHTSSRPFTIVPSKARPKAEWSLGNWVGKEKKWMKKKGTTDDRRSDRFFERPISVKNPGFQLPNYAKKK